MIPAQAKKENDQPDANQHLSFKQKRDQKKKGNSSSEFNWNSLFMSVRSLQISCGVKRMQRLTCYLRSSQSDTVAQSMATELAVEKADILDRTADSMALGLALSETHIINETKQYLEEQGIALDAFEFNMKKERSTTIILVKNIPFTTSALELRDLFSPHGTLGRIVLPPTKTIALVEFAEPSEARNAFRHLAYKKFKHLPLYLEWAPVGTFAANAAKSKAKPNVEAEALAAENEESEGCSVFVKNLSFQTTEAGLRSAFETVGNLRSVTVATKNDPKHSGQKLSMGFGFVEFATKQDAQKALLSLQDFVLDGHTLQLKLSQRKIATKATANTRTEHGGPIEQRGTKLIARNVPFEATRKELQQLFA